MDVQRLLQPIATPKKVRAFQRSLLAWYRRHGRNLPWRRTRDPYAILISEFMLQQTQVVTVISYYNTWLRRFPDFAALAQAAETDVLHAWQGLGYYARARNLHATAKAVMHKHAERFPRSIEQMQQLPGIGKYTAHAVAAFAFDQPVPILEANTARVLARVFDFRQCIDRSTSWKALWKHAATLVPKRSARIYNSALTDLGALICLPRRPRCEVCPVKKFCQARKPETLPIKKRQPPTESLTENHALVIRTDRVLLERSETRWRGMWILPPLKLDCLKPSSFPRCPIYNSVFPFTHHRVTLRVFRQRPRKVGPPKEEFGVPKKRSQRWVKIDGIESIPMPSPHRRAVQQLLSEKISSTIMPAAIVKTVIGMPNDTLRC